MMVICPGLVAVEALPKKVRLQAGGLQFGAMTVPPHLETMAGPASVKSVSTRTADGQLPAGAVCPAMMPSELTAAWAGAVETSRERAGIRGGGARGRGRWRRAASRRGLRRRTCGR